MADLKPAEVEDAEFAYDIYKGFDDDLLDGTYLLRWLNALNLHPSLARLEKFGVTKKAGEKKFKLDEVLPIYSELKKEKKDQGCFEDFIECLKLYDKADNGKCPSAEIHHSLMALGEKLTEGEIDEVFTDCMDEEDDDGDIVYTPFLRRVCGLDPPIPPKKKK